MYVSGCLGPFQNIGGDVFINVCIPELKHILSTGYGDMQASSCVAHLQIHSRHCVSCVELDLTSLITSLCVLCCIVAGLDLMSLCVLCCIIAGLDFTSLWA